MNFWILILLGVIQGLTEFLPISSSGHLVLLYNIFGIKNDTIILSIILHLATLLAVIVYYRKDIWLLIKNPFCATNIKILITTIATGLVVLIIKPIIDIGFQGIYLPIFFVLTGVLLWISDWFTKSKSMGLKNVDIGLSSPTNLPITYSQAIVIGVSQGIACIPGISRSGTTIAVSKIIGVGNTSAKYSFLISIPTILASLFFQLLSGDTMSNINIFGLLVSMLICFLVGLACIKIMTEFVKKSSLKIFSIYLFAISIFMLINDLFLHLFWLILYSFCSILGIQWTIFVIIDIINKKISRKKWKQFK